MYMYSSKTVSLKINVNNYCVLHYTLKSVSDNILLEIIRHECRYPENSSVFNSLLEIQHVLKKEYEGLFTDIYFTNKICLHLDNIIMKSPIQELASSSYICREYDESSPIYKLLEYIRNNIVELDRHDALKHFLLLNGVKPPGSPHS